MNRRPVIIKGRYYSSVSHARKQLSVPRISLVYAIQGTNEEYRYATEDEIEINEGKSD